MRCRLLTLIMVCVFVPAGIKAQSSVTLKATVSETVSISVPPSSIDADVVSRGNTVRLTWSSIDSPVIRVPLLVRSNTGFKISAVFESQTAVLSQLSVDGVRATGGLVSPQVVNAIHVNAQLDPDTSRPLLVLSGPRVSLGGTVHSPNNALEITLLISLKLGLPRESPIHLTIVATPELLVP
jgi:hypothetical protein